MMIQMEQIHMELNASYEERNFETNIYFYGVGENFNPEVGFAT